MKTRAGRGVTIMRTPPSKRCRPRRILRGARPGVANDPQVDASPHPACACFKATWSRDAPAGDSVQARPSFLPGGSCPPPWKSYAVDARGRVASECEIRKRRRKRASRRQSARRAQLFALRRLGAAYNKANTLRIGAVLRSALDGRNLLIAPARPTRFDTLHLVPSHFCTDGLAEPKNRIRTRRHSTCMVDPGGRRPASMCSSNDRSENWDAVFRATAGFG